MKIRAVVVVLTLMVPAADAGAAPGAVPPSGVAACSNCHPSGRSDADRAAAPPPLAGKDAAAIVAAMTAFRSGARPSTVMGRIAKGFSDDEIATIAAWFAAQR